jgi:hypothetical protein
MNKSICDKKDCPFYGYFLDAASYPDVQATNKLALENSKKKDGNPGMSAIYLLRGLQAMQHIGTTCTACTYFEKQDMYTMLLSKEAKKLLVKED